MAANLNRGGIVAAKKRKRTKRECKEQEDGEAVDGMVVMATVMKPQCHAQNSN